MATVELKNLAGLNDIHKLLLHQLAVLNRKMRESRSNVVRWLPIGVNLRGGATSQRRLSIRPAGVADVTVVSKRQVRLTSTPSRHRSFDGDCDLGLSTPAASIP